MADTYFQVVYSMGDKLVSRPKHERYRNAEDAVKFAAENGALRVERVVEQRDEVWSAAFPRRPISEPA